MGTPNSKGKSTIAALFILNALKKEGIEHVFLVPGYVIDNFYANFSKAKISPIVAAQEGGAAYMADGYARASQKFGVCMGVGGPGVTNMLTAISAAYMDRSPILLIAGSIQINWEGKGTFQDSTTTGIDQLTLLRPMTAYAEEVPDVNDLDAFFIKALRAMRGIQNLPVCLSIQRDFQTKKINNKYEKQPDQELRILDVPSLSKPIELLKNSTRIAILAGNGSVRSNASEEIQAFAEEYNIPVVTTLRAKGIISEESPMSFGVWGTAGSLQANMVVIGGKPKIGGKLVTIPKAELLLVLGASLNENNTLGWRKEFDFGDKLVRVDVNPNDVRGKEYQENFVMGDVKTFLKWMDDNRSKYHAELSASLPERKSWTDTIKNAPYYDTEADRISNKKPINPARAIAELRKAAPRNTILVVDSGAHTFFTGHNWTSYNPNEFFLLTTTGPMGYGIAMGIGVSCAQPDKPCICVVGDGSMLMHGMELHTAVKHRIPLVIVVINNGVLGNVYLRARKNKWGRAAEDLLEIDPGTDWAAFAKSLNAKAVVVDDPKKLASAYRAAINHVKSAKGKDRVPYLIDVRCDKTIITPNPE